MAFLSHCRVLDLTDERGMLAGRILADLGADVVQVEPVGGSSARACLPADDEHGSFFFGAYAANKRGIQVDLDTEEGRSQLRELACVADILIESADVGDTARRGLDWPDLHALNPTLIYVSITAFGRTGPKAGYAASDLTVWASGGPLDPHRFGDDPPLRISLPQSYLQAAADAAAGALFALHARNRTGRGQHVDVSAQASLTVATLGQALAEAAGDDKPRYGQRLPPSANVKKRTVQLPPARSKWQRRGGLVEFQLGLGPAAATFTPAFVRWMVEDGDADRKWLDVDWATVPDQLESGTFTLAQLEELNAAIDAFLASRTLTQILDAATERKLLCAPICDTADVAVSPQLAARNYWFDSGEETTSRHLRLPGRFATVTPDGLALRRPAPLLGEHTDEVATEWLASTSGSDVADFPATAALPLAGLKVLDLSWVVAGPLVGRALADFGATVIRVESSTRIETARQMPPYYNGVLGPENSALYETCNAGKLGVTINMQTEEGRRIACELAQWSDVVVESYSPGQMAKWGLDYESLKAGHDDLIMLSSSIMGQTGPYSRLSGYGTTGSALSGFQDVVGWPDRPAVGPFGPYTDYLGPRLALPALLAALEHRRLTGEGCYLDVSQVEAGVYFQSPELAAHFATGAIAQRIGNADLVYAPHGVYSCQPENDKSRYVAVAVRDDAEWQRLCELIGRPDLAADPDLATSGGRRRRQGDLDPILTTWTSQRFAQDAEAELQKAQIAAHISASSRDLLFDPQLLHRNHLRRVKHPLHGEVIVEGPRYLLSETPAEVTRAAPILGQDNEEVLIGLLGYDEPSVTALVERGVLR